MSIGGTGSSVTHKGPQDRRSRRRTLFTSGFLNLNVPHTEMTDETESRSHTNLTKPTKKFSINRPRYKTKQEEYTPT